jgi:hypothetical protein
MMGLETFPFAMDAAAQKGRLCGGINYRISWKPYLPRRAQRGVLMRGALMPAIFMVGV